MLKHTDTETFKLRQKISEVELYLTKIRILNDLFTPYANEHCPEGSIVADLIGKNLDIIDKIIKLQDF